MNCFLNCPHSAHGGNYFAIVIKKLIGYRSKINCQSLQSKAACFVSKTEIKLFLIYGEGYIIYAVAVFKQNLTD